MNKIVRVQRFFVALFGGLALCMGLFLPVAAASESAPELYIQSLRVRGEEFVLLQSNTNQNIDLSTYKLQYFNHFDALQASSSKLISLSNAFLPPNGSIVVASEPIYACQDMIVSGDSLGFTDSTGLVQLVSQAQTSSGGPVSFSVVDSLAWSSKPADVSDTVQKTFASNEVFYWRDSKDDSMQDWHWVEASRDPENMCQVVIAVPPAEAEAPAQLAPLTRKPTAEPPATILPTAVLAATSTGGSSKPIYPARSVGLEAPQITELLPNPGSPKKDATDEFIELYNGNDAVFELSGFTLRYGVESVREYTFPQGVLLEPKSFTGFFSADASFALTNSLGKVELVDPYGNIISSSDQYEDAKDDQSWALAGGTWQWTSTPTPGIANTISVPAVKAAATKAKKQTNSGGSDKANAQNSVTTATTAPGQSGEDSQNDDINPMVLAGLGSLTIGYAIYEYRQDIANKIDQFRRNRAYRRANRAGVKGQ